MSSVFTSNLENITIEDIRTFCKHAISEGPRIEYKAKFPQNLVRTICAFSNSWGGIILLGVEAEKRTNKPIAIPGIELKDGLEERVINLCLSHIMPRVDPEVKVCDFKSSPELRRADRAVLFIRVRRSFMTPHYLQGSNDILVRIQNRNARADLRTIENLIDQREEVKTSQGPIAAYYGTREITLEDRTFESVVLVPHFPLESITFYSKEENDWLFDAMNAVLTFHRQKPSSLTLTFLGVNAITGQITSWCSITREGRIVLQRRSDVRNKELNVFSSLRFLLKALRAGEKVYSHFGYYGDFSVGLVILNTEGLVLPREWRYRNELYECHGPQIRLSKIYHFDDLSQLNEIIKDFLLELCLEYGLVLPPKVITQILKEILTYSN